MTTPTLESVTETAFTGTPTAHACDLPATINAGDLLIVHISISGADTVNGSVQDSTGDTWTELWEQANSSFVNSAAFAKVADGDEDSGTVTINTTSGENAAAQVARVSGFWGTIGNLAVGTAVNGSGSTPDPPSVTAIWGAEDNLWLAFGAAGDDDETFNSAPSGYSGLTSTVSGGGTNAGASAGIAYLASAAATENPGTFGLSGSEAWVTNTVGIRPATSGGEPVLESVTPTAFSSGSTGHACDLPATVDAGDILIVHIAFPTGTSVSISSVQDSTSDSWTSLWDSAPDIFVRGAAYYKIADGDEDGGTVTVTTDNSVAAAAHVVRASNFHGSGGIEDGTPATGSATSYDPPSLTASWGAERNLFLVFVGAADDDQQITTAPTGFDNLTSTVSGAGTNAGAEVGFAALVAETATVDPSAGDIESAESFVTNTVVLRPAAAAGGISPPSGLALLGVGA